jgi:hypothetical protein
MRKHEGAQPLRKTYFPPLLSKERGVGGEVELIWCVVEDSEFLIYND